MTEYINKELLIRTLKNKKDCGNSYQNLLSDVYIYKLIIIKYS